MDWSGKKVFVTGAGGFIGSHLVEHLVELGANVTAFVHYNSLGSRGWLDKSSKVNEMKIITGDVCDPDMIQDNIKGQELVFHLAALIAIPYSYQAPVSYVRTNIEGTINVMRAARYANIERLICTSTSEVYGTALYVPIDEKHPLQGQSPYSASKIGADKMIEAFHKSYALPTVTVRPFNTFGPRQSMRAVIPTIIAQLLKNNSIRLGSLTPTRDLNFVTNTVSGFVAAAESIQAYGKVINIGSGHEISIGDLAQLIAKLMDKEISITSDDIRLRPENSEVERLCADNSLAKELLNWKPQVTLENGLKTTINWFKDNQEGYRPDEFVI